MPDDDDHIKPHVPPLPSKRSRSWNRKTKASARDLLVTPLNRVLHGESGLEAKAFLALIADPRVVDVREQPPFVEFVDDGGKKRKHTVDLLATMRDGSRVAVLVKPRAKADRMRLDRLMLALARHVPRRFADRYVHIHEGKVPRNVVSNGQLILGVRTEGPFSDDPRVLRMAEVVDRRMSVGDALRAAGRRGSFRALVRLVVDGRLRVLDGARIDVDAMVEPVPAIEGEAA